MNHTSISRTKLYKTQFPINEQLHPTNRMQLLKVCSHDYCQLLKIMFIP